MMARFEIETILGYTSRDLSANAVPTTGGYVLPSTQYGGWGQQQQQYAQYASYPQGQQAGNLIIYFDLYTFTINIFCLSGVDPAAAAPTDPTAYYNDFWQYASYYGEVAARAYYGAWSPPEGTPPPEGIVIPQATAGAVVNDGTIQASAGIITTTGAAPDTATAPATANPAQVPPQTEEQEKVFKFPSKLLSFPD
jgi:hypothetical protein